MAYLIDIVIPMPYYDKATEAKISEGLGPYKKKHMVKSLFAGNVLEVEVYRCSNGKQRERIRAAIIKLIEQAHNG